MKSPAEITRTSCQSLLGMTEMEDAAQIILDKCRKAGRWVPCYHSDFNESDSAMTGFVELVGRGWLNKGEDLPEAGRRWCYNGGWVASKGFVERIS